VKDDRQYWFPAKRYGWGWGPPTKWQGWVVLVVWIAALMAGSVIFRTGHLVGFRGFVVVMALLLVLICYWKGEPPRWRWGN
jgi:hypothetical protein